MFYYKNLCFVILPERSNSNSKDAYEQLIEKFEGLNNGQRGGRKGRTHKRYELLFAVEKLQTRTEQQFQAILS